MPPAFREDIRCWTAVLRGTGRWPTPPLPWPTIRGYLTNVLSTLTDWAPTHGSLRDVTAEQVRATVTALGGSRARTVQVALRSLFRALKRERRVFRDPARSLTLPAPTRLPRPLPTDRLAGLLDRVDTATARTVLALTAIHAVGVEQLRHARLDHLDRVTGRLALHHPGMRRTLVLDEVTLIFADRMLRDRHRRWPRCTNPHLIVSQITAAAPADPAVSQAMLQESYTAAGGPAQRLRRDRILDEARHTADPVQLVHLSSESPWPRPSPTPGPTIRNASASTRPRRSPADTRPDSVRQAEVAA
ncbi:hypothetical protein VR45_36800, partial [Streptomyces sp. NRRL S-495]